MADHIFTLKEAKYRIEKLNYRCAKLFSATGETIIAGNNIKAPSKLTEIWEKLQYLPQDNYIIHVYNGGRDIGYKFHITNDPSATEILKDPSNMVKNSKQVDPEIFGKLQSDYKYSLDKIQELESQLADYEKQLADQDTIIQDLQDIEPDPILAEPPPSPMFKLAEGLAPAIPGLMDAIINALTKKNETPVPSEAAPQSGAAPFGQNIDYDQLAAAMVRQAEAAGATFPE